jgi:hypothetical protein
MYNYLSFGIFANSITTGNKTVRHQDISVPLKKSVKSAPHFLSNKRDYLF